MTKQETADSIIAVLRESGLGYQARLERRFWAKVDKSPGFGPNGDCWKWTAALNTCGYGSIGIEDSRTGLAHHVAFTRIYGHKLEAGLEVCHECDNPACVRESHLTAKTHKENMEDSYRRGRRKTKLTPDERLEIVLIAANGIPYPEIRRVFPVSNALISRLKTKWTKNE